MVCLFVYLVLPVVVLIVVWIAGESEVFYSCEDEEITF